MDALEDTTASLLPDWPPLEPAQRNAVAVRCAGFVRQQLHLAPLHIRVGVRTLFAVYRCFALLQHGFHPITSARAHALAAFSALPFPMVFGLERVLRSMCLLCYFEQPEVLTALGEQTLDQRQLEFRRRRTVVQLARAPSARSVTSAEEKPLVQRTTEAMLTERTGRTQVAHEEVSTFLAERAERISCDALVIGTGAGGASVAATLAQAGLRVIMVEEGPYIPAATVPLGLAASTQKMWRGAGLLSTFGSTQIAYAEGRCVGGGTEINSAIFQRAPEIILERWAAANHLEDFSPSSLAPYYERAAGAVNASITATDPGPPTQVLARAGQGMGWKVTTLERGQRHCVGTNLCSAGCPTGGKQSMSATLIPAAIGHGARLISKCRVQRLTLHDSRATGALAAAIDSRGRRHVVSISADAIFLCAGTTHTPLLIRSSGLATRFSQRFQLHPTLRVLARFREPIQAHRYRLPLAAITEFTPDVRFGGSVFTLSTYAMALAEDWRNRQQWLSDYAHYVMYYAMIRPDGEGRIFSLGEMSEPIVTYRLTERDWRRLGEAVHKLSLALLASGAERVVPSIRGHEGWHSAEQLLRMDGIVLPRDRALLISIHLFGSCPMGEGSEEFPVDSFGRLRGVENVIVADGSTMPGAPGVNPQATIMALSFRAADAFLARY